MAPGVVECERHQVDVPSREELIAMATPVEDEEEEEEEEIEEEEEEEGPGSDVVRSPAAMHPASRHPASRVVGMQEGLGLSREAVGKKMGREADRMSGMQEQAQQQQQQQQQQLQQQQLQQPQQQ
eukprot:12404044-Karenia_brevis.AAC.1